jgi:hypothetical protein
MTFDQSWEWSVLERRATRRAYVSLMALTGVVLLIAVVGAIGHLPGIAVPAGAAVLLGAFNLVMVRRHGVFGRPLTARRQRVAAAMSATIGLVLFGLAIVYAIRGPLALALVFGVVGAGVAFLLAAAAYVNARAMDDAAAAVAPEPARAVCADQRGLRRGAGPVALVVTPARVAQVQASPSGASELGSIGLTDIASVEAGVTGARGNLVVHGAGVELAVRRAPPSQVHAALQALRRAGVPAGG